LNIGRMRAILIIWFALMLASLYSIFVYVPTEATMGVVQRIFYFHIPLAWNSFLAFFIVFLFSIIYLVKREAKWDRVAAASAHIGVVFTTLTIVAGFLWSIPSNLGIVTTPDPRLIATIVLWIIYVGYLLVRSYFPNSEMGARLGAVIGIVGFVDVPIVALATVLWPTSHPGPLIFEGGLVASMVLTLMVSIVAFTVLYVFMLLQRIQFKDAQNEMKKMKRDLDEHFAELSEEEKP
jgi:heme exporter protein C